MKVFTFTKLSTKLDLSTGETASARGNARRRASDSLGSASRLLCPLFPTNSTSSLQKKEERFLSCERKVRFSWETHLGDTLTRMPIHVLDPALQRLASHPFPRSFFRTSTPQYELGLLGRNPSYQLAFFDTKNILLVSVFRQHSSLFAGF